MLKVRNLYKSYGSVSILKGIDLDIAQGEVVALVGPSGAGKSTLLHILGTLDVADRGEIWIQGQEITKIKGRALDHLRNRVLGFVFQFHHLLPEFSVLENVCLPAFIGGRERKEAYLSAMELLEKVGLSGKENQRPMELSGGEQQRVAVARALINRPAIILADEPSGNLDKKNAQDLHDLFLVLNRDYQQTFFIISHNEKNIAQCNRALRMEDGSLIQENYKF